MAKYLVEIRFGKPLKPELRTIIDRIANKFDERELVDSHYVPHISLFGPFHTNEERIALARLRDVCAQYDAVPYAVRGFEHFDNETIYADIHSSDELRDLRQRIYSELNPITRTKEYDHDSWFKFHATVARNVRSSNFRDIWQYVNLEEEIDHETYVKRVSLIKNNNIVKEYSVPQGRFLNSNAATEKPGWKRDDELIERWQKPSDHGDLISSQPCWVKRRLTDHSEAERNARRYQRFDDRSTKTYVIGDLHLNHGNIIEYCDRPFDSWQEMNQELIANWNDTVGPGDRVILLGDLALYYGTITTHDWLHALNGDIVFIQGNHDEAKAIDYDAHHILESDEREFYCTHWPSDIPEDWEGWAIHGHKHNNDLENFPFINREEKQINVSAEVVDYEPVSVDEIEDLISKEGDFTSSIKTLHIDLRNMPECARCNDFTDVPAKGEYHYCTDCMDRFEEIEQHGVVVEGGGGDDYHITVTASNQDSMRGGREYSQSDALARGKHICDESGLDGIFKYNRTHSIWLIDEYLEEHPEIRRQVRERLRKLPEDDSLLDRVRSFLR